MILTMRNIKLSCRRIPHARRCLLLAVFILICALHFAGLGVEQSGAVDRPNVIVVFIGAGLSGDPGDGS